MCSLLPASVAAPPPDPSAQLCRHCHQVTASRPRGLCRRCFNTPGIRDRYPPAGVCGHCGRGNFNRQGELPTPTTAEPGSEEKVAVLEERARRGLALHHPNDRRIERPALAFDVRPHRCHAEGLSCSA